MDGWSGGVNGWSGGVMRVVRMGLKEWVWMSENDMKSRRDNEKWCGGRWKMVVKMKLSCSGVQRKWLKRW